jgi:hypothetical protein
VVLLPIVYLRCMIWAWRPRVDLRAKSGAFGRLSLWFPLLTTVAAAWIILFLMPSLLGAPVGTLSLYQPDLGVVLIATAATGVLWAVFRLGVAYTGRSGSAQRATPTGGDRT